MIPELGQIVHVDPRTLWANEAHNFTPWLAGHIEVLGEALGLELELTRREAPVGPFSLDLLVRDVARNQVVIVENQLEDTDHDHLGKLLTYAAGYNASSVIWIAPNIREEHRQTIDWLNQHTDASIDFYAVALEVIRIGDSKPAVNFRPLAFPNDWRKARATSSSASEELSERQAAYQTFFQRLIDELRDKHSFTGARKGLPQNWYTFKSGHWAIGFGASFGLRDRVLTEIYIDTGDAETTKALFDSFFDVKGDVERAFGAELSWERLDNRRASRIGFYRDGSIQSSEEELDSIREWMIANLLKFKGVFQQKLFQELLAKSE